jgi:hypothetical protein
VTLIGRLLDDRTGIRAADTRANEVIEKVGWLVV